MNIPASLRKILKNKSRAKYGNHKIRCLSKHLHDSKLEANHCNSLMADMKSGKVLSYECQVPFEMKVNGILICKHIVDFMVLRTKTEHLYEVHECKSFITKTAAWSIKHKLFKALYPSIPYIIVTANKK